MLARLLPRGGARERAAARQLSAAAGAGDAAAGKRRDKVSTGREAHREGRLFPSGVALLVWSPLTTSVDGRS